MAEKRKPEVVVITGASAGVGRATVREFARHGAHIALIARGIEGLEATRQEVEQAGGRAITIQADVADADQVDAAASRAEEELGPIDIWINNAMTSVFAPVAELTPEEFTRVTYVTYLGTVYGTMSALRRMRPRNRGTIVQVGSALAYRGIPLQAAYCGAKHAIQGFTDSLRAELIHEQSRIHVTMVQLPAVNTPQFRWVKNKMPNEAQPVPPIYQPEVPARAIYWSAHHRRRELFVGRMATIVIVGNKIFPGIGDLYLGKTGVKSQQTDEPRDPDRPYNLWAPVAGDYGAHGVFDDRSKTRSPQLWAVTHRAWLLAGAASAGVIGTLLARNSRKEQRSDE